LPPFATSGGPVSVSIIAPGDGPGIDTLYSGKTFTYNSKSAMSIKTVEKIGDVKICGHGSPGGKGLGLARINEYPIPKVSKLKTRILTTTFYDRFRDLGGKFGREESDVLCSILNELGDVPIGVRSSATNEAATSSGGTALIHSGEYTSHMLPNNHPDAQIRLHQVRQAIAHIFNDFARKQPASSREKMAIILNPIPGIFDDTLAGPCYYPYISGVANSYFPHALKTQDPKEGVARIAFGHGYATVLDDFPVISMATIKNPIPLKLLQIGNGQQYFYALDMTKNRELKGEELETMKKLHVNFANYHKIKLLGIHNNFITIEELIQNDHFRFKTSLIEIMETISARISAQFQIEFVFNINFAKKDKEDGMFHVVQLTPLPELKVDSIPIPQKASHVYLSIKNSQGHGIIRDIHFAVVISPFVYSKDMHDAVRDKISAINRQMHERHEHYILIVPGRLGSKNKDWGIFVDYGDVDRAAAIFEYGVDIAGRAEPLPEDSQSTGGIYGSHFLYMIQGGYDEDQKKLQTRMFGTQGTHFLTNLMGNNIVYGYIAPGRDRIDPWLFTSVQPDEALSLLSFPHPATLYADSIHHRCKVIIENVG